MKTTERVSQIEEVLLELIHTNEISEKRLRLMEIITSVAVPFYIITLTVALIALGKAFEMF